MARIPPGPCGQKDNGICCTRQERETVFLKMRSSEWPWMLVDHTDSLPHSRPTDSEPPGMKPEYLHF